MVVNGSTFKTKSLPQALSLECVAVYDGNVLAKLHLDMRSFVMFKTTFVNV